MKKQNAFTLAETLITLTILGVVAAITVPMLIIRQMEAANRTKVKKAMATYEKALNQMIVDNDIKGKILSAEGFRITDNCSGSSPYFKAIKYALENNTDNICRFQTSDRVWWDITNIEHPIIAFNEEDLDDTNAEKRFVLVGHLEDGVLRINDRGFETTDPNKTYLTKLYNFINKVEGNYGSGTGDETTEKCTLKTGSETYYKCTGSELTWIKATIDTTEHTDSDMCVWNGTTCTTYPDYTSKVSAGDLFISEVTLTQYDIDNSCIGSRYEAERVAGSCKNNLGADYWNAYRKKCEANDSHLATAVELKALYEMSDSPLDSGSYYWTAETRVRGSDNSYGFDPSNGEVDGNNLISDDSVMAICVGN